MEAGMRWWMGMVAMVIGSVGVLGSCVLVGMGDYEIGTYALVGGIWNLDTSRRLTREAPRAA